MDGGMEGGREGGRDGAVADASAELEDNDIRSSDLLKPAEWTGTPTAPLHPRAKSRAKSVEKYLKMHPIYWSLQVPRR